MARYVALRVLRALVTLVVFQTILFFLVQAMPWDYVSLIRGSAAFHRAVREAMGLNAPAWVQYLRWMGGFLTGNLGASFLSRGSSVTSLILASAPRTLLLFLPGALLGFGLGIWLGRIIGWRRGGWVELGASLVGTAFYASFPPWLAFTLVQVFAIGLGWFPAENLIDYNLWLDTEVAVEAVVRGLLLTFLAVFFCSGVLWSLTLKRENRWLRPPGLAMIGVVITLAWLKSGSAWLALDILRHLALPLATLVLLSFGETMLLMRSSMINILGDDHVVTARAKGVAERPLRDRHVARLALLPVVSRFVVQLPLVLVGSFVLERIFTWRGLGMVLFQAVDFYDYPVMMGILSVVGIGLLLAHLVVDIVVAWLDPRMRYQAGLVRQT